MTMPPFLRLPLLVYGSHHEGGIPKRAYEPTGRSQIRTLGSVLKSGVLGGASLQAQI